MLRIVLAPRDKWSSWCAVEINATTNSNDSVRRSDDVGFIDDKMTTSLHF